MIVFCSQHIISAASAAVFRSCPKTHLFSVSYRLYGACAVTVRCFGHYNRSYLGLDGRIMTNNKYRLLSCLIGQHIKSSFAVLFAFVTYHQLKLSSFEWLNGVAVRTLDLTIIKGCEFHSWWVAVKWLLLGCVTADR